MILELNNVAFSYPSAPNYYILDGINICISKGKILQIRGRNGSGKTTLLKIIAGIFKPTLGSRIVNKNICATYLDQNISQFLAEALTVREQFSVGSYEGKAWYEKAGNLIEQSETFELLKKYDIDLHTKIDNFVAELSGGQQQIVALLSILLTDVDILVLDEFTSFMDVKSIATTNALIENFVKEKNISVVYVSHKSKNLLHYNEVYDV